MDKLIEVLLYLILGFSPYLVYWCMKTKERAMTAFILIIIIVDLVVLHFYFDFSLF